MRERALTNAVCALGLVLAATLASPSRAQTWPSRPITLVIPLAVGSGLDVVGRLLAARLSELLGQQVIVENIGGAGGMTGAYRVAKGSPDGYQLLLGTVGTHAQNQTLYKHPLYNAATDFAPVGLVAEQPTVLLVRKDLPVSNLREFVAYAKLEQAKMRYGSAGAGSAAHLACALLNARIGVNITHIPYRGGASAIEDLLAGRIDYQCPASTLAIPQVEAHAAKGIAILTRQHLRQLPTVGTADDQGLAGFDAGIWYALFFPKGTPAPIVHALNQAVTAALETPALDERLSNIGVTVVAPDRRSPEYLAKFVASEIEKWSAPITANGISAD